MRAKMKQKMTSKDRRHQARKHSKMKAGQYGAIVPGAGLNPLAFVDEMAGLIRVTPDAILLYR